MLGAGATQLQLFFWARGGDIFWVITSKGEEAQSILERRSSQTGVVILVNSLASTVSANLHDNVLPGSYTYSLSLFNGAGQSDSRSTQLTIVQCIG